LRGAGARAARPRLRPRFPDRHAVVRRRCATWGFVAGGLRPCAFITAQWALRAAQSLAWALRASAARRKESLSLKTLQRDSLGRLSARTRPRVSLPTRR